MKTFEVVITILTIVWIKKSSALVCTGCDMKNNTITNCDFKYPCPMDAATACETIISKVEGIYSITTSCATAEKCGNKAVAYGFDKCNHQLANTECYQCCESDQCNQVADALAVVPAGVFQQQQQPANNTAPVTKPVQAVPVPVVPVPGVPVPVIPAAPIQVAQVPNLAANVDNVSKVNQLIDADEMKYENGSKIGEDKVNIGNDTNIPQVSEITSTVNATNISSALGNATNVSPGNETIESPTATNMTVLTIASENVTTLNETAEEDPQYLDFPMETSLNETLTGRKDEDVEKPVNSTEDTAEQEEALDRENSMTLTANSSAEVLHLKYATLVVSLCVLASNL